MEYKYITENNLENRQNYMYSSFNGNKFLNTYISTREKVLLSIGKTHNNELIMNEEITAEFNQLRSKVTDHNIDLRFQMINQLKEMETGYLNLSEIDLFVKTFEVRKRLYHLYSVNFKPINEEDYKDNELYLIFSIVMCLAYEKTSNLKYLNSLLKVNDILISLYFNDSKRLNNDYLSIVLNKEIGYVNKLCAQKNIAL
ncbi:MAG: hypothetical protein E7222_13565 [Clostridiales bacterium]|jgi:hypothetical protein|nr:hypothetical protein [Clostridiales bacterium]